MYENRIMNPSKNCLKGGKGRGLRKSNIDGEFD
jgi:hypothetical protein